MVLHLSHFYEIRKSPSYTLINEAMGAERISYMNLTIEFNGYYKIIPCAFPRRLEQAYV